MDAIDLVLQPATMTALMGPSGSGKSTLIRICAGLETADAGLVRVADRDVPTMSESQRARLRLEHVGVVFQDHTLIPELTAAENIELPLRALGHSRAKARAKAREALSMFDIEELAGRLPAQMSGGQQQRVGIARAMTGQRSVLLADEPTGALDRVATRHVFDALRQAAQAGVTVLVATHDRAVAEFADAIVEIDGELLSVSE